MQKRVDQEQLYIIQKGEKGVRPLLQQAYYIICHLPPKMQVLSEVHYFVHYAKSIWKAIPRICQYMAA